LKTDLPHIVLFNPPGKKIYIRDYYCSKVSKAYYLPQPVDLLMQSAYFSAANYQLTVIDAIAEKKDIESVIQELIQIEPILIIGLMGSVSLNEDINSYERIKSALPSTKIICSGDALLDALPEKLKKYNWLTAILTNFYLDGPLQWLEGKTANGLAYFDQNDQFIHLENRPKEKLDLPTPQQALFKGNYRMPFTNAEPVATVLTNYACPYPCTFCIMSTLPFMSRTAASIIAELTYLKESGYRFIYFSDQTFFQSKSTTKEVLKWMIETQYEINWMCFSRVDVLDKSELELMKKAGCKLIMFGVEWAEDDKLTHYKKHYTVDQIKATFALSKSLGIQRLGTFLIGVPGQTRESILNTVAFAKEIKADYASFNVAVPRSNTSFRDEALDAGLIDESQEIMDQSGDEVIMGSGAISREELQRLKSKAYRSFYIRPGYLFKRIMAIRNWTELKYHTIEGYHVLKGILKKS
jgi:radical SAM superfamily enzyme YgiQ (UPF0313 family)